MFTRLQWFSPPAALLDTCLGSSSLRTMSPYLMKEAGPLDMSVSGKGFQAHELQAPLWLVSQSALPDPKIFAEPWSLGSGRQGNSKLQKIEMYWWIIAWWKMKSNYYNKEIRINEENERIHVRNVLCIQNGHLKNYKRMKKSQTYHGGLVNKQAFIIF